MSPSEKRTGQRVRKNRGRREIGREMEEGKGKKGKGNEVIKMETEMEGEGDREGRRGESSPLH